MAVEETLDCELKDEEQALTPLEDRTMQQPLVKEIHLRNLLSFGPDGIRVPLRQLNVIIGPNGSGKSNLLEALGLLRAAPKDLSAPVKESGGVRDWLWKGSRSPTATIEAIIENPEQPQMPLRHSLSFEEHGQRFEVRSERIENRDAFLGHPEPYFYYSNEQGHIRLTEKPPRPEEPGEERSLPRETIKPEESVLSQLRDPERYPALAHLNETYSQFRLYREWSFGRHTPPRQPQKADTPNQRLGENCENLALVLNSLRPLAKRELLDALGALFPEIEDFNVQIEGGWIQLVLQEGGFSIPATRLSDGTLRYLCLLAILCHPEPPPLVCIEEPELGLHPDVLPTLAQLMVTAAERCQLVVTTHSDILVDALTERPEAVLVCEKHEGGTEMRRLSQDELGDWLEKYRLGQLWLKGKIGGTRW